MGHDAREAWVELQDLSARGGAWVPLEVHGCSSRSMGEAAGAWGKQQECGRKCRRSTGVAARLECHGYGSSSMGEAVGA